MFLPSKFYIHNETDQIIEFREKKAKLYIGCFLLIALGAVLLISFFPNLKGCPARSWWKTIILISIGVGPMTLGFIPMLTIGKIVIDKNKKSFSFYGGVRKFFFKPKTVNFSKISCVAIKREQKLRYGRAYCVAGEWDVIVVKMHGESAIEIDYSNDSEYIKEMAVKISEFIGCTVYFKPLYLT